MHPILANCQGLRSSDIFLLELRGCLGATVGVMSVFRVPRRSVVLNDNGTDRYVRRKCRDISSDGLRVELTDTFPREARSACGLKSRMWPDPRGFAISAGTHAQRDRLELSQKVQQQLLDALRTVPGS